MPQQRLCRFCGKSGHDTRTCPFPGAALLRKLVKEQEPKSKQVGRRPPRAGSRTRLKAHQDLCRKAYSGAAFSA